jgi:hypothetical protein
MASALLSARDSLREYMSSAQLLSSVLFAARRANICQHAHTPTPPQHVAAASQSSRRLYARMHPGAARPSQHLSTTNCVLFSEKKKKNKQTARSS